MKKFYVLLVLIVAVATINGQTYSIYTAKKSGTWSDMTMWNVAVRGDGVKKMKVVIPAAFTVTVDNGISVVGMGDGTSNTQRISIGGVVKYHVMAQV